MAKIGVKLRHARNARGLTQDHLAEKARIRRTDLVAIEADRRTVGDDVLDRLAAALEVSRLELLPDADPDEKALLLDDRQTKLEAENEELRGRVDGLEGRLERLYGQVLELERQIRGGEGGQEASRR